jgi:hypothetical protein
MALNAIQQQSRTALNGLSYEGVTYQRVQGSSPCAPTNYLIEIESDFFSEHLPTRNNIPSPIGVTFPNKSRRFRLSVADRGEQVVEQSSQSKFPIALRT